MKPPSNWELLHTNELTPERLEEVRRYLEEQRDWRKARQLEMRMQGKVNKYQEVLVHSIENYIRACNRK